MKQKYKLFLKFLFILLVAGFSFLIALPGNPKIEVGGKVLWDKDYDVRQGLDLQGGARLVYVAKTEGVDPGDINDAMKSLAANIESRVNSFGVSEPIVQTAMSGEEHRLIVEMPGVTDIDEAIDLIGKTAKLEFKTIDQEAGYVATDLTGEDLKKADVTFDELGNPQVSIEFQGEGIDEFAKITEENVGQPLATFLDDEPLQIATVNEKIVGGKGVISGEFDLAEAQNIAIQLNAGALPLSIELIEQREVGATLGQESVEKSLYAGAVGIIFVALFMIAFYRFQGVLSTIGLGLYLILMLAIVKLLGITMTMGGIAGLILSVGMTMETDVLVFERIREELRNGKSFESAIRLGFRNAWPSIRDSNAVSAIIAALLYTAGGTIRGFAVVLILGIIVGLATTFIGTKTLMAVAIRFKKVQNRWLFRVEESV
ncbi:MAG: protein translocase subunit SecD [Patescibacteria group bacterium]|nr:protein translocase subunit SecD [Patescibacteria group bacterium]